MTETATQLEAHCQPGIVGKIRLLRLDQLDGRTLPVKHIKDRESRLEASLGGNLVEGQRMLVGSTSFLYALIDDSRARWASSDPPKPGYLVIATLADYLAAHNAMRRDLVEMGALEHKAKSIGDNGLLPLLGGQ